MAAVSRAMWSRAIERFGENGSSATDLSGSIADPLLERWQRLGLLVNVDRHVVMLRLAGRAAALANVVLQDPCQVCDHLRMGGIDIRLLTDVAVHPVELHRREMVAHGLAIGGQAPSP